jgi:response regulator RpfG family c-di-GMP phosphodiesterase
MLLDDSILNDLAVLVVDDESDILETVEDELYMCILHKASNFDEAKQYLLSYTYDIVILDIMGVNGFELLKISTSRGFPTVILTAHALTSEALKKSIQLGAIFFLPKETLPELRFFLEELVINKFKHSWMSFFDRLSVYFNKYFDSNWKERDRFFEEFERSLLESQNKKSQENI